MRFQHTNLRTGIDFECQLQCGRCTGTTARGTRCRNRVCIGVPTCHQHRKALGLKVKQSTIPNAGKGLFATKDFKKNKVISSYGGNIISKAELDRRYGGGNNDNAPYSLSARNAPNRILDSACRRSLMSLANSKRQTNRNNAKFSERLKGDGTINVRTTKRVRVGDEIFIDYGKGYWKGTQWSRHTTK